MILRAYKVQLDVNNKQQTLLLQHIGCARWAYNWALAKKKESFDKKEKIPNAIELHRELNKLKQSDVPWMYNSSKTSPQNALRDCDKAFNNFFTRCKKKIKGNKGFPKFKSKKNEKQSFRLDGAISVESDCIKLPRIGKLKLAEKDYIPTDCKILSATVSKRAGKWFVSVQVETPDREPSDTKNEVVGIDLGIKTLATFSDGTIYENPKALKKNLKRLKRKQKQLSRKKRGSKKYEKAKQKLAKLHYHISNIRKDCLHKITSKIIDENQVIVLEYLKVRNMMKNHCLAQAISDVGLFEFRRQIYDFSVNISMPYKDKNKAAEHRKKYQQENREKLKEYARKYYAEKGRKPQDAEERKQYLKKYREENKETLAERQKEYREKNKESRREQQAEYRELNREKRNAKSREWYYNNQEKRNEYSKQYQKDNKEELNRKKKERYHKDVSYRLKLNLRNRLNAAIRNKCKSGSAVKDLGCSIDDFILYIESLFCEGMTWENWGEWHLDHIKPLSKFDLDNREQFLEACNYKNIQPLWALDNLQKSNKN